MSEPIIIPQGSMMARQPPSDDFNKYLQEMTQVIKEMDLYLQGLEEARDQDGNIIVIQKEAPKVNAEGRRALMSWMRNYLNPNTYMSYIKDYDTRNNYNLDKDNLLDDLVKNHKKYKLNLNDMQAIHSKWCGLFFFALKKSETDKKYIFGSSNTNYTPTQGEEQKKTGFNLW